MGDRWRERAQRGSAGGAGGETGGRVLRDALRDPRDLCYSRRLPWLASVRGGQLAGLDIVFLADLNNLKLIIISYLGKRGCRAEPSQTGH